MAQFLITLFVFFSVTRLSRQEDYCYAEDENPNLYFSSVTSYSNVRSLKFEAAKDCEPIYAWALIKNGATYMSKNQIESAEKLSSMKDEILKNYADKRGKLCQKDQINFQNWNTKFDNAKADQLVTTGVIDLVQLARRLKSNFNSLLKSDSKESYEFQTSNSKLAQDSGLTFVGEILQTNTKGKDGKEFGIVENSMLNENQEFDDKEMKNFYEASETSRMIKEISARLGFQNELKFDDIKSMYDVCSFETAWNTDPSPAFCAAFLPDESKIIEYGRDLRHYYTYGYGNTKNDNFEKPLFEDMLTKIIDASEGKFNKKGSFYFSQSSPISAVLKKLDLYHDEQPLKYDNYKVMKGTRKWRSSFIDCFATNIIAVLYRCSNENDKRIEFYHNETPLKSPLCEKSYCTVEELKKLKSKPDLEPERKNEENKPKEEETQPKNDEKKDEDKSKDKPQDDNKNEAKSESKSNEEAKSQNSDATISFVSLSVLGLCSLFSLFTMSTTRI